ncbi:hypothetical protein EB077_09195, partial [bacterium]|nr:hypothetical protein [bacterium]
MATATATTTIEQMNPELLIVKVELFDPDVMDALCRSTDTFSRSNLWKLTSYKKARKHGNQKEVVYHYGEGCDEERIGRLYAKDNQGLQAFPFDMRNPLLEKHYWDIDMENAHYCLMRQMTTTHGLPNAKISYYCDNREDSLKKVSSNRRTAKTAFLKVAYGGDIKLHSETYDDNGLPPDGDITLLKEIEKEIKVVIAWLKANTETNRKWKACLEVAEKRCKKHNANAEAKKKKNPAWCYKNPDFSFLALVLQTEECKCLLAMDEYFRSVGRSVDIFIHDGCEVRKLDGEQTFPTDLLRGCEAYIKEKTGYTIKLVNKPFRHSFKMPTEAPVLIDDAYACKRFVDILGDGLQREGTMLLYFNDETGVWEDEPSAFYSAVVRNKDKLVFKQGDMTFNYGGSTKLMNAMKPLLTALVKDTKFLTKNADTSYGKLLWDDGIYDFYTDTFTPGFDRNIVFYKSTNRPFPKKRNEELIQRVRKTFFEDAFDDGGEGLEEGEYLLKALTMGLVGDYRRKKFYMGIGEPDCGKGGVKCAMKSAFGGYIGSWDANNLKYNPRNGQDEARKMGWCRNLIGYRLAFSDEFRMEKTSDGRDRSPLDGNLIKKVVSGGDELQGRGHQQAEMDFVNKTTLIMFCNDVGTFSPHDEAVKTRKRVITYKNRFVDKPEGELEADERVKDPCLKEFYERDDAKDAFFFLVRDTFQSMEEKERMKGGDLITPESVMKESNEWGGDGDDGDIKALLLKRFDFTGVETDVVPSKEFGAYIIVEKKRVISENKLGRIVSKMVKEKNKT